MEIAVICGSDAFEVFGQNIAVHIRTAAERGQFFWRTRNNAAMM
jgi:hypothetical protein